MWWCFGFVLLKIQGFREGVSSGSAEFHTLLWKSPLLWDNNDEFHINA